MKRARHVDNDLGDALRVLLIERPGSPLDRQRAAIAALGLGHGVEYVNDLDGWLRSLRHTDTAVVMALHLLAPPLGTEQPTVFYDKRITQALASRAVLIDAQSTVKSTDGAAFAKVVKANRDIVRAGRHMTRRAAKARAAKRTPPLTTAQRLRADPQAFGLAQKMWTTRGSTDAEAFEAVNEMLVSMGKAGLQLGSPATARRTLGKRPRKRG